MIIEVEVSYTYTPGRPAPQTQDPDNLGYADPGDPEEIDATVEFLGVDITEAIYANEQARLALENKIREEIL